MALKAYRMTSPGSAAVVDVEPPRPGPHDALLRVRAAGVCHTDVSLLRSPDAARCEPARHARP